MNTQNLVTTLATLQEQLRIRHQPLRHHRIGTVDVLVFHHGIQVLDDQALAVTPRAVCLELAAVLIETS